MDKAQLMAIGTIVKGAVTLIVIILSLVLLISGLSTKDRGKIKKSAVVFFGACGLLILLSVIEFLLLKK